MLLKFYSVISKPSLHCIGAFCIFASGQKVSTVYLNKRSSGTAIFFVNVAHEKLIEDITKNSHKDPNMTKKHLDGDLIERAQAGSYKGL